MIENLISLRSRSRQILSVAVAIVLITSVSMLGVRFFNFSHAATGTTMYVQPNQQSWTQGSNVSVTVRENSGTSPVLQASFFLNYNANQLQYTSLTETGDFDFVAPAAPTCTPTSTSCATSPGQLRVMRGRNSTAVSGDKGIVTVNFKVVASSGTSTVSIDQANSSISGGDGVNQLATGSVSNGSYTISPMLVTDAALSISPASANLTTGSTLPVVVHIKSPTQKILQVHAVLTYPTAQLQYLGVTDSAAFPNPTQTNQTAGTVDMLRGVAFGSSGVTGDADVVTVNFKVTGASGSVPVSYKRAAGGQDTAAWDANGKNLLGTYGSANYTFTVTPPPGGGGGGSTGGGDTPGSSTGTGSKPPISNGSTSFKASANGNVSLNGDGTQIQGSVDLSPVANPEILAQNPNDSIVEVEYFLGKQLVAAKKTSPFSYTFDTKHLRNGTYDLTIKTHYSSGAVDSKTNKLLVKNPVTVAYVMAHYSAGIFGSLISLVAAAFLLWRYVWPRFGGGSTGGGWSSEYAAAGVGFGGDPDLGRGPMNEASFQAPEPDVISPSITSGDVITPAQTAASEEEIPLALNDPQVVVPPQTPASPLTASAAPAASVAPVASVPPVTPESPTTPATSAAPANAGQAQIAPQPAPVAGNAAPVASPPSASAPQSQQSSRPAPTTPQAPPAA